MKTEPNKVECRECYWKGQRTELLTAPDPFCPGDNCFGCPKCKSIDCFLLLCDEPGCSNSATCGTPTPDGYRSTCHHHVPRILPVVPVQGKTITQADIDAAQEDE